MPGIPEKSVNAVDHQLVVVSIGQIIYSGARQISLKGNQIVSNNCIN